MIARLGAIIDFVASASDTEDGDLSSVIVWLDNGIAFGKGVLPEMMLLLFL